jgi:outer membrane protein assembly factor BamB
MRTSLQSSASGIFPVLTLVLLSLPSPGTTSAEEWSRFRGPNGNGVSDVATIPATWTDRDYVHNIDLPGDGNSSPVLWQDKLFITAADTATMQRHLLCYSASQGKLLWKQSVPFTNEKKHAKNTYATNTPSCDAERVYTIWQSREKSELLAFDHAGKPQWQFDLGPFASGHGCGLSPIVVGSRVVVNNQQEGNDSYLLAVEAKSGQQAWRVPREKIKATYSTPCVFRHPDGKEEIIFTSWHHGFTSVDPATGKINWERDVFEHDQEKRSIGSPIVAEDLVLGNCGFAGGKKYLVALRPAGEKTAEIYRLDKIVNHQPTALVVGPLLFLWNDQGVVTCAKAATGDTVWQKRVGGNYAGSPVCVGKRIYAMSQDGELVVLAAAEEFQELARIKLPHDSSATPAVGAGLLWLRAGNKLLAVGKAGA